MGIARLRDAIRNSSAVRSTLIPALVVLIALPIAATLLLLDLRTRAIEHSKGELRTLSRMLVDQTERTYDGVKLTMRNARERLQNDVGRRLPLDSYLVQLMLQGRVVGLPQVKSMFVVDNAGRTLNSSRRDFPAGLDVSQREFFRYFAEGGSAEFFISRNELAHVDGEPAFYVATRLADTQGPGRGLLVVAMRVAYFEDLYRNVALDAVQQIRLLRNDGQVLAASSGEHNLPAPSVGTEIPRDLGSGGEDRSHVIVERDAGDHWYVSYRPVTQYPLVVSASVDERDALESWDFLVAPIAGGTAAVCAIVVLFSYFSLKGTVRKAELELEVRERGERLNNVVQSVNDAIVTIGTDRRILLCNSSAAALFGWDARGVIGTPIDAALQQSNPAAAARLLGFVDEGLESNLAIAMFGTVELALHGETIPVEFSLSSTRYRGGPMVTLVLRNVIERHRAEQELIASNRQLQELSQAMDRIREEERASLSRELHDELGQMLTGIRMELSWLASRKTAIHTDLAERIGSVKHTIDQAIQTVRRISSDLRPSVLDDLGFAAAAGWYVDQFVGRSRIRVDLALVEDEVPPKIALGLFRILQEALTNVARHAQASFVEIGLAHDGGQWRMHIRDDGAGFEPRPHEAEGVGLLGMRERARALGGEIAVRSHPGQGTTVEVFIPEVG